MRTTDMSSEALAAAADAIPEDQPVVMINLLRYREQADYGDSADVAPCSGREAYFERYIPAFNETAPDFGGAELVWLGSVLSGLVAPADERWDDIALVEYRSFDDFRRFVTSERYLSEADPHRSAALEDWRLIATAKKS